MASRRLLLTVALLVAAALSAGAVEPKRVLVFGDSVAWGWVPQADGFPSTRYPADVRWPGVMRAELGPGYEVVEDNLNGRTTDITPPLESASLPGAGYNGAAALPASIASQMPLDLVVLALGQNDLRLENRRTPLEIGLAAMRLVTIVQGSAGATATEYPAPAALLVAPAPMPPSVADGPFREVFGGASARSRELGPIYARLAAAAGVPFLDAGKVTRVDGVDSVHLTPDAHAALGKAVAAAVRMLVPLDQ
ncbi:MAG TPA: GDSL-type esterase/lipase family protein [Geminicoccaceae bacterium]|nr:GDSL-type esterase/lipase family protein [Geminicoccaceae bacterium]